MQRQQDVVLRLEVVVEGRLGDAQLLGDLPQAGAVEALLGEEVESHIEDALPRVGVGDGGLAVAGAGGVGSGAVVAVVVLVGPPRPGSATAATRSSSSSGAVSGSGMLAAGVVGLVGLVGVWVMNCRRPYLTTGK